MKNFLGLMTGVLLAFIVIMTIAFTIGCKSFESSTKMPLDTVYVESVRVDTFKVIDRAEADSLIKALSQARDSVKFYRDSIPYENYINARRIEKIKYYINICEKKPTNKKFFYGWIKRTMTE